MYVEGENILNVLSNRQMIFLFQQELTFFFFPHSLCPPFREAFSLVLSRLFGSLASHSTEEADFGKELHPLQF